MPSEVVVRTEEYTGPGAHHYTLWPSRKKLLVSITSDRSVASLFGEILGVNPWLPAPMFNNHCGWAASLYSSSTSLTGQREPVSSCYDLSRQLVTNVWKRALSRFLPFPCKYLTLILMTSSSSFHTRGSWRPAGASRETFPMFGQA